MKGKVLTPKDEEYYEKELQALKEMAEGGEEMAAACKLQNISLSHFKARWNALLRAHSPSALLLLLQQTQARLPQSTHQIAQSLHTDPRTVRTILRRLRTAQCETEDTTKAKIGQNRVIRKETLSKKKARRETPDEPLLAQVRSLLSEQDSDCCEEESPTRVLAALAEDGDFKEACERHGLQYARIRAVWGDALDISPKRKLEAVIYAVIVLTRLRYGYSVIADYLHLPATCISSLVHGLRLHLEQLDSFDVVLALIQKDPVASGNIAERCGVPTAVARAILKRAYEKEDFAAGRRTNRRRALWLFERGLSLSAITLLA